MGCTVQGLISAETRVLSSPKLSVYYLLSTGRKCDVDILPPSRVDIYFEDSKKESYFSA
jgi:hypothetical protein